MKKIVSDKTILSQEVSELESLKELKKAHDTMNGDIEKVSFFYDTWSDRYDKDVEEQQYAAPAFATDFFMEFQKQTREENDGFSDIRIMDAGCGTGLTGIALQKLGYTNIDGCDISKKMVDIAMETKVYRSLYNDTDVNNMSGFADHQYDAVISCGVFTPGHVFPEALRALVRITKTPGFIVLVTRISYYKATNFQQVCDTLKEEGLIRSITRMEGPYDMEERAYYWGIKL